MGVTYHTNRRLIAGAALAFCTLLGGPATPSALGGYVNVNVTRVGFPTIQLADAVRRGAWAPIIVDLDLVDLPSFDGSVRVGQFDQDGDECYDRVSVHLRADTGEAPRLYLFVPPSPPGRQDRFVIELFNEEGEAVQLLSQGELTFQAKPSREPVPIEEDDILILSLSTGAIGRIQDLTTLERRETYLRQILVGHMSPDDLPELWIGLEMVDYILWDDARPEELTKRQINALVEWVRQGGTLLLAASRTAGALQLTDAIRSVLPVELGEVAPVDNLPDVRENLLSSERDGRRLRGDAPPWWATPFDRPVPVVQCTLLDGAIRVPDDRLNRSNVVTRRRFDRGHVIFSAVVLQDLFRGGGDASEFFKRVLHLNTLPDPRQGRPRPVSLLPHVTSAVAFARSGSWYFILAIGFSLVYVLVATFGSWSALGSRGWRRHSWSVFALVGIACSLLSVVVVGSVRGLGETLHQISVVDAEAGSGQGYATTLFGVKTGTDRRLDFWLPSDPLGATEPDLTDCFLRPLPVGADPSAASSSFADPGEYRLFPANAVISDVRIRATLKRFEGRWAGALGGTVTGEIAVRRSEILEGSYIVNNLGVDLRDCYLLHPVLDIVDGPPRPGTTSVPRSGSIFAFPIGQVPADGGRIELAPRCYPKVEDEQKERRETLPKLADAQSRWGSEFSRLPRFGLGGGTDARLTLSQEENALLLLSTVGDYDYEHDTGMVAAVVGAKTWSRDGLRHLDLREQLRRDTVMLIGFADDPGPVRLFRRTGDRPYRVLEPDPDRSWTMYRIRIPVTLHKFEPEEEAEEPAR